MRQDLFDNIFISMSPQQSMMARAALHWSRAELAAAAGIGVATVVRFESGSTVQDEMIIAIQHALQAAGVEFIAAGEASPASGPGVRLRSE